MLFQQPFDARTVAPSQAPEPVPAGEYKVLITESAPLTTNDQQSGMLVLTLRIVEGQFTNRELSYRLNLWNQSQKASEIAYRQLSAICHVTGVFDLRDSQQLHGIPFIVAVEVNEKGYNNVRFVKDLAGNQPGKKGTTAVASATPAPAFAAPAPAAAAPAGWPAQPPQAPPAAPAAPAWGPPAMTAPPAQPQGWPSAPPAAAPAQPPAGAAPWSAPQAGSPPAQKAPWEK